MKERKPNILPLVAVSTFLGAALLFFLQPMFGKIILPRFGGAAGVWITCLVFFQVMLLAGYLYVHATISWLGPRKQALLHTIVLLIPIAFLPIRMFSGAGLVSPLRPMSSVFVVLLGSVGLPFFAVSTTAPLLQRWFGSTGHRLASDPFFLYAASNLGSIGALLAYPIVVEPALPLKTQQLVWSAGYALLVVLTLACLALGRRSVVAEPPEIQAAEHSSQVPWQTRLRWIALSAVPSSLLLSVTSHVTMDIAPVPLLWVVPLAIYLATFVLAFSRHTNFLTRFASAALPFVVVVPFVIVISGFSEPPGFVLFHLFAFFLASLACHGQLAKSRPGVAHLTEFYVWLALGGALGGLFNLVVAPVVFRTLVEYPVGLILACLLRATDGVPRNILRPRVKDIVGAVVIGVLVLSIELTARILEIPRGSLPFTVLVFAVPVGAIILFYRKTSAFALSLVAISVAAAIPTDPRQSFIATERSFFGVRRIANRGSYRILLNGNIDHGAQSLRADRRCTPLSYYYPTGPAGDVFTSLKTRPGLDVAIVGLGTGSIGGYAQPGQHWTFYEIDPAVERIARNPEYFTFLRDCVPQAQVVLGDARLSIAHRADGPHDVIVIDAFSSDAIPTHLLTREAMILYERNLKADGVLAFHISNRYVNLRRVLGRLARDAHLVAYVRDDRMVTPLEAYEGKLPSAWVVMARSGTDIAFVTADPRWLRFPADVKGAAWTDDYSNVFETLKLQM